MTTPLGIVRFALLLASDTAVQPTDGCESVTVQVLVPPGEMVPGAQLTESGAVGTFRLLVDVCEDPPRAAVTTAAALDENCCAVATNVVVAEPLATATEAGTDRFPEFDERLTVAPVEPLSVTVQVLVPPGASEDGEHPKLLTLSVGTFRLILAVREVPFREAVMPAAPPVENCWAVTEKVAAAEPFGTVTVAGAG